MQYLVVLILVTNQMVLEKPMGAIDGTLERERQEMLRRREIQFLEKSTHFQNP